MKTREKTRTDLVVTPLPLTPCGCQRVYGTRKGEIMGMVKGQGGGVGWGGVAYVWDSVDREMCNVGVWTRAPTAARGARWQRAHVRVSVAWSGLGARGLSRSQCGRERWAVRAPGRGPRAPGPEGGARSSRAGRTESRAGVGARQLQAGRVCVGSGKAGTCCLPAANSNGAKARVSDAWVRQLRSRLSFLGSGTHGRHWQLAGPLGGP